MKPAPFDYLRPASLEEALEALDRHGEDAKVLAGGQSLMPVLNMRLAQPRLLVDISRLEALAFTRADGGMLTVGASTTQATLERRPTLAAEAPLVAAALPSIGHHQIRSRGTVCGSVAHADPTAELPLCLLAVGGEVVLRSRRRRRTVSADAFFLGTFATARRPDELVEAVRFPLREPGVGLAFREVSERQGDFALVACAAVARPGGVRFAVAGLADRPVARDWPDLEGDAADDALNDLAWEFGGSGDRHGPARYRRELVRRIGRAVIEEARACRS